MTTELKNLFKKDNKELRTTEEYIKLSEDIKNLLLPLFEGLSKTESEIVVENLKEGLNNKMRVVI